MQFKQEASGRVRLPDPMEMIRRKMRMRNMKRWLAALLAVVMVLPSLLVPGFAAGSGFEDVPENSWYASAVEYVNEKGYMTGVGNDKFAPDTEVTRAMFVTVLSRLAMVQTDGLTSDFADVESGKWYTGAIAWAAENSIVNGVGGGRFAPTKAISRQDLCTILYRFVNTMGYQLTAAQDVSFTDASSVSAYASDAVRFAASVGLVAGYSDGAFHPKDTATRAQTAVIVMRLAQLLDGQIVKPEPMPAQYFEEYPAEDMKVAASAPQGALPENSSMNVSRVTDKARLAAMEAQFGRKVLLAADISFRKDATELEPNKEVNVSITCDLLNDLTEFSLVHIADDGSYEYVGNASLMTMYRGSHSKMLRFSAKDFSVYAVLEGQSAVQVNFFNEGATEPHNMQKVIKNGNEVGQVFDPGVDLPDAKVFVGWTIYKNGVAQKVDGKDYYDIAAVNSYLVSNFVSLESIDVKAVLHDVCYLAYVDETDRVLRTVSLTYSDSNPKHTVDQDYFPANSKAQFYGWTLTKDSLTVDYPIGSEITVTADEVDDTYTCRLYPVCKRGNWLVFDNNIDKTVDPTSATFTSPQIVLTGENTVEPAKPTRTGYTFDGWYTTPACTEEFDFGNPLLDNDCDEHGEKKLYAKWEAARTKYLVVYMVQDPNNPDQYIYQSSERRDYWYSTNDAKYHDAMTGNTVNAITASGKFLYEVNEEGVSSDTKLTYNDAMLGYYTNGKGRLGFFYQFNSQKTAAEGNVKLKGDGSSIVRVYYDLRTITYNFYKFDYQPVPLTAAAYSNNYIQTFFLSSGGKYYPTTLSTTTFYPNLDAYVWTATINGSTHKIFYVPSYGYWYMSVDNGPMSSITYGYNFTFYFAYNNVLDSSLTTSGRYGSDLPEGAMPELVDGMAWAYQYPSGSSYGFTLDEFVTTYRVPGQIGDSVVVNYYELVKPATLGKKTVNYITQNPNTGVWQTEPYRTQDLFDTIGITFSNIEGAELIFEGYNLNRNSREPSKGYVSASSYEMKYENVPGDNAYVYLRLNTNELAFESNNNVVRKQFLRYRQDFKPYQYVDGSTEELYEPDNGVEGYYFDDWYTNNTFLEKFNFATGKMPNNSVTAVAKWTQERFRVVLDPTGGDPNVQAGVNGTTNPNEVYFPDNQATTFKIWYGESVLGSAVENVARPGYELVGWYVDTVPNNSTVFDTPFNFNTPIKDDVVDLSYKDAPAGERQGTDLWNGNLAYNDADGENDNVIGKLVIYAKWRKVLQGDTYVRVVYDCADGTLQGEADWTDPLHYADQAQAVAAPAAQANEAGYMFAKWTVMKNENGQLVETNIDKLPGDTFDVLVENAGDPETIDGHTVYTVYLKASYSTISNTHITWYGNGGVNEENKDIENSPDAIINSFTNIKPADTFTRDGYVFLGWARLNEDDCSLITDDAGNITAAAPNDNLDADDLWLIYDEENDSFKVNSELDRTAPNYPTVSMVAPDENTPYHIMYAVWSKPTVYYVYHSATGKLEAIDYKAVRGTNDTGTDNLQARVTEGYLYGGYYSDFGGLSHITLSEGGEEVTKSIADLVAESYGNNVVRYSFDETTAQRWAAATTAEASNKVLATFDLSTNAAKTGYEEYTGAVWNTDNKPYWTKANAYGEFTITVNGREVTHNDDPGTALHPVAGKVYYLKEVPAAYLPARMIAVHETGNNQGADVNTGTISAIYLLTAVDDVSYRSYGFLKGETLNPTGMPQKSTISKKFKVYYKDKNGNVQLKNTYTAHDLNNGIGENDGYVVSYQVPVEKGKSAFILPTWITLDGVTVSQNQVEFHVSDDGKTVTWTPKH